MAGVSVIVDDGPRWYAVAVKVEDADWGFGWLCQKPTISCRIDWVHVKTSISNYVYMEINPRQEMKLREILEILDGWRTQNQTSCLSADLRDFAHTTYT